MTAYEAETIIIFNEEEEFAEFYTASVRVHNLLARRGYKPYKVDTMNGKPTGWHYKLPKTAILIKPDINSIKVGGRRKVKDNVPSGVATAQVV